MPVGGFLRLRQPLTSYLYPCVLEITIQSWLCDLDQVADLRDRKVSLFVKTGCKISFVGIKDFGPASCSAPGPGRFESCPGSFLNEVVLELG